MSGNLKSRREGAVLRLTLARPERRNALNLALCQDLLAALDQADADPAVGAILIDGEGPVFCAGMDLKETLEESPEGLEKVHVELFSIGLRLQTPMVAALHGACLAGGMGLALNAHWALAAEGAKLGLTEVRIGMWPYAIYSVVERAVGERRALQLTLEARLMGPEEGRDLGLVDAVYPAGELPGAALELCERLAAQSREAIREGLSFVRSVRGLSIERAQEITSAARVRSRDSADFAEGVRAFLEKRPPQWPSHKATQTD